MGMLDGQVAVVTGAGGSIGRGIAVRLAREGAYVVAMDAHKAAADATISAMVGAGGDGTACEAILSADGAAPDVMDAAAAIHRRLDILVNAGQAATPWSPFIRKTSVDFEMALQRSALNAMRAMQAVFPHMKARGGGRIVNVGSFYGGTANLGIADAVTSDGALYALTRSVAMEWARHNITVNYVQPGATDIPEFLAYHRMHKERVDHLIENLAIPRLADPVEDIGGAVLFLVSEDSRFIIGQKVHADGGQHAATAVFEPGAES